MPRIRIRELQESRGITQKELSKRSGVSVKALYLIQIGEVDPRLTTVCRIAYALGVRLDELVSMGEDRI